MTAWFGTRTLNSGSEHSSCE